MVEKIKPGLYRHYKGKDYQVYSLARHSETEESFVVYRCLYGDFSLWIRPAAMFQETITTSDGKKLPRFNYIGPISKDELKEMSE